MPQDDKIEAISADQLADALNGGASIVCEAIGLIKHIEKGNWAIYLGMGDSKVVAVHIFDSTEAVVKFAQRVLKEVGH